MIIETFLNDGTIVCIRKVGPQDEERLKEGIAKLTPHSRYLRFFSGMPQPPQRVIDTLISVDGHDHIAWGAIATEVAGQPALGVVHAFRDEAEPHAAEFSVAVIDEYHGRGLARLLTAVLLLDCRREALRHLTVNILPENQPALALTRSLGGDWTGQDFGVSEFDIDVDEALASMMDAPDIPGLAKVFAAFD